MRISFFLLALFLIFFTMTDAIRSKRSCKTCSARKSQEGSTPDTDYEACTHAYYYPNGTPIDPHRTAIGTTTGAKAYRKSAQVKRTAK